MFALFILPAAAQDTQTASNTATATAASVAPAKTVVQKVDKTAPEPGVSDVLKMLDAGVSKDVLKAYVENSTVAYNLTSADIIALKEHGVTDDITVILLKRSAESRAQVAQAASNPNSSTNVPVRVVRYMNSANVDPESEDYFQYYYLYPRTLAYSYQTLGYPFGPYNYSYSTYGPYSYGPYGYGPRFGPAYGPRHFHH
jgi:hypothetical protein